MTATIKKIYARKPKAAITKVAAAVESVVTPWSTVGLLTYKRTYSRKFDVNDGENAATEEFPDTINRVLIASQEQLGTGFSPSELERLRKYFLL